MSVSGVQLVLRSPWYQSAIYAPRHAATTAPVEPVKKAPAVEQGGRPTYVYAPAAQPTESRLPEMRQGADPVEMAVRGRIRYLNEEEIAVLRHGHNAQIVAQIKFFSERTQCTEVGCRVALVERDAHVGGVNDVDRDEDVDLTAGNSVCLQIRLDFFLKEREGSRKLDRAIKKAVVDRADLDGDILSADGVSRSAKSSHTFHFYESFVS